MLSEEAMNKVLSQTIAKQLLESLGDEDREAFLARGIEAALKDYHVKQAVQEVVAAEARRRAEMLMKTERWGQRVAQAVEKGVQRVVDRLPAAFEAMIIEGMCGTDGTYGRGGKLLEHLRRQDKDGGE